jgi:hypothetical protein
MRSILAVHCIGSRGKSLTSAAKRSDQVESRCFVILSGAFQFALRTETRSRKIPFLPELRDVVFGNSFGLRECLSDSLQFRENVGILRLRSCFAARTSDFAQEDYVVFFRLTRNWLEPAKLLKLIWSFSRGTRRPRVDWREMRGSGCARTAASSAFGESWMTSEIPRQIVVGILVRIH